jgi:TRAP-type C4-dicarboxylate transport system permease small subunit
MKPRSSPGWERILVWAGGVALLAATAVDTLAALGRYIGLPLRGSIEFIQPPILVAGMLAILLATIDGASARVRLLVDRLRPRRAALVDRLDELLVALFFGALFVGSAWIAADLWSGHEVSEVVGVPWRWLRLLANFLLAAVVVAALRRAFRRGDRP